MVTLPRGCAKGVPAGGQPRPVAGRKRCRRLAAAAMHTTRRSIEVALTSRVSSASPQQQTFTCFEDSSFIYCHNSSKTLSNTPAAATTTTTTTLFSSPPGIGARSCLEDAGSPNTTSSDSFLSSSCSSATSRRAALASDWNTSGSLGCISALDYWHLGSSSDSGSDYSSPAPPPTNLSPNTRHNLQPHNPSATQNHQANNHLNHHLQQQQQQQCSLAGQDPVYLEDVQVFHNLLLRESAELKRRPPAAEQPLKGRLRHLLLSWMLKVCEHQLCQDEIFPLATMILDKYLLFKPAAAGKPLIGPQTTCEPSSEEEEEQQQQPSKATEEAHLELAMRQMYLFASCALLLATKLRQTPKLSVHTLAEFSGRELPVELRKEEIIEGELLLLATLKWDLVSLVAPNDFLALLMGKCQRLLLAQRAPANEESRVLRHTQSLLELCLMDSKLSQYAPSALAMSSMAVAIDGLSAKEKTCGSLTDIVTQIHEATHRVIELKTMIDVAYQIEKYVQTLLTSSIDD